MSARSNTFRWAVISLMLVITCNRAFAGKTLYVDDDGPADFNNIQAAIDDANDGDSIIVQTGLYKEFVKFHGKNITLTSTNPGDFNVVAATIIDYGAGFVGTEEPNCTLTGFKINGWISGVDYIIDPTGENHTNATISYCLIQGNSVPRGTVIRACDGTIINCVVVDNWPFSDWIGPAISECHGLIKNCIVAHNFETGIWVSQGCTTTIENCIIYYNPMGIWVDGTVNILYTDVDGGIFGEGNVNWGTGNIDADPCFVRVGDWFGELKGDYHLKSQAGRWNPMSETWVQDDVTSPCIDAGAPMSVIGHEQFPNGGRVNIGAYGGTPEASKSYFGQPVCETIIAGDINGDCIVDWRDFAIMAFHWLEYTAPELRLVSIPGMPSMPNPASIYCHALGYKSKIVTDEEGNQYGVCIFPDGSECGSWDFYRGKCGQEWSYCERCGYDLKELGQEGWTKGAMCIDRTTGEEIGTVFDLVVDKFLSESVCETIIAGDINGDYKVDFADLAIMAAHWLEDNTPANSNCVVKDGVEYYLQTNKAIYRLGENVEILYRVTNLTRFPVDVGEILCGGEPHFAITDDDTDIWQYLRVILPCGFKMLHLGRFERKEFQKVWNMTNDNGTLWPDDDYPVGTGRYKVTGELELEGGYERVPLSVTIEIIP